MFAKGCPSWHNAVAGIPRVLAYVAVCVASVGCRYEGDQPNSSPACNGQVCDAGYVCANGGQCIQLCPSGLDNCTGTCSNLKSDRSNCGLCGHVCDPGFVCDGAGNCGLSCQSELTNCNGTCVNAESDALACGASCLDCNRTNGTGSVCVKGTCACNIGTRPALCGGVCVDLDTDRQHCGDCSRACDHGEVCLGGACTLECGGNTPEPCDGGCADLQSERANCGACGNSCKPGFICDGSGKCALSCQSGLTDCSGSCVNVLSDRNNCGACDHACDPGFACDGTGNCALQCQNGLTNCSGMCTNTKTDRSNCGTCGNPCDPGQICDGNGSCTLSCQSGLTNCSGTCVKEQSDRNNCGTCGNKCQPGSICDGTGECSLSCQSGLTNCSGTCVNTQADRLNCGTCKKVCDAGFICDGSGNCKLSCQSGLTNCNGVCVNELLDQNNCGACLNRCAPGFVCDGTGNCALSCQSGLDNCGGRCVNTQIDPANCGACGSACPQGGFCSFGQCTNAPRCLTTLSIGFNANTAYYTVPSPPKCELLSDDTARMTFTMPTVGNGPYAACVFATGQNFNDFDADNQAAEVLEVEFCSSARISGELNLWYGLFPTRKKIELLRPAEFMDPGCRTVRRAPEEAKCHWTARAEWEGDCSGIEGGGQDKSCRNCLGRCNWGCKISFSSTLLTLIAEQSILAQTQDVVIDLKAVTFLPKDCTCTNSGQCQNAPNRTQCESGLFSSKTCPPGASICGVCIPPVASCAREGDNCVVELSDRSCPGTIVCRGSVSMCEVSDSSCVAG